MKRAPEGLVARIQHLRRALPTPEGVRLPAGASGEPGADPIAELRTRLAHVEQMVQGLQDSVYREAQRQEKRLSDLEMRMDPAELAAALSKNARERGL
jgi:uncharacterized coiled-coil protein SlyX